MEPEIIPSWVTQLAIIASSAWFLVGLSHEPFSKSAWRHTLKSAILFKGV